MKKVFMTLAVAGMVAMASCGSDNKSENDSANTDTTKVEESCETDMDSSDDKSTETVSATSASDLQSEMEKNDWKLDDKGNLVDAYGKIIETYQELADQFGAAELGQIVSAYGVALDALDDLDKAKLDATMAGVEVAADLVEAEAKLAEKAIELSSKNPEDIKLEDLGF